MIIFDILRIIAALMVFSIHLFIFVPQLPRSVCDVLTNGSYGVSIFFVMSGFLIFSSLERSKSLKEYYIKRVSRIIPAYYFIITVGIVLWGCVFKIMPADTYAHIGWLRYFLCLNTWLPSNDYGYWNNLWGLWTISCFVFFYIVAPFIKKVINNYNKSLVFMLVMIPASFVFSKAAQMFFAAVGAANPEMLGVDNPIYSLNTFAMGICAWYAYREGRQKNFLKVLSVLLAGFIGINWYNRMLWGLLAALAITVFTDFSIGNKKVVSGIKLLGRYSFDLYLVHLPVIEILDYFNVTGAPYLVMAVTLSVVCAVLLYHLVENPCAKLIKKLC
ncbi:MAG: acyltransferase family protein [Lachnospiraceae bacterium]